MYNIRDAKTVLRGTLRYKNFSKTMAMMASLGLFEEKPVDVLQSSDTITWAEFTNQLARSKGSIDVHDYLVAKYGEQDAKKFLSQLHSMQIVSGTPVAKGYAAPIDALAQLLVTVLKYEGGERDLVLLMHEFGIEYPNGRTVRYDQQAQHLILTCTLQETKRSTLYRVGEPNGPTAMSVTVGVPAAIATELILGGMWCECCYQVCNNMQGGLHARECYVR